MKKVIFFTGAGISKDSGIPTFEETNIRKKLHRIYAITHPKDYRNTIRSGIELMAGKEPNAAHYAIAELGCPVITMNVDQMHSLAGSKNVLQVHGDMPTPEQLKSPLFPFMIGRPVLYGDFAPRYYKAFKMIKELGKGDLLVIVGASFFTQISTTIRAMALRRGAGVITINEDASRRVPELCSLIKEN